MFHDFFVKVGSEYNRNWDERKFVWNTNKQETEVVTEKVDVKASPLASFFSQE